jgi:hypothetical protein
MAKKKKEDDGALPYFKFFMSEWIGKDITLCSLSAQGLFINLCAHYWLDKGNMSYRKMKLRFKRKQKHFDELITNNIIKLNEDEVRISFLDQQLIERDAVSETNRKNIQAYWNRIKSGTVVSESNNDRNTNDIPKEEKREEEKRKEEKREDNGSRIASNGFEYEFQEQKPVPREARDLAEKILDYFAASKDVMSPIYSKVENFIAMIFHRGEFEKLKTSFEKYQAYKARSQEQIHSIEKWMGTIDKYFQDGKWTETNWELKLKNYERESTKGVYATSGPEPGKDYSGGF